MVHCIKLRGKGYAKATKGKLRKARNNGCSQLLAADKKELTVIDRHHTK